VFKIQAIWIRTIATASPLRGCVRASDARMKAKLVRTGKNMSCRARSFSLRRIARWRMSLCRRLVGIPNHGTLRIGDTLTEARKSPLSRASFAPEIVRRCPAHRRDEAKKLKEALQQMSEEACPGVPPRDGAPLWSRVGPLQSMCSRRARCEYALPVDSRSANFSWHAGFHPTTAEAGSVHISQRFRVADDVDAIRVPGQERIYLGYTKERARALRSPASRT